VAPDVIVNAAAYTAVDRAESEPLLAQMINALAPGVLAREAKRLGACLVHYSTDYVFDGTGDQPRVETDPAGPLNVYGQTKYEGERAITESGCHHLIFRTSWVYAARGKNFPKTMLKLAQERDHLKVIDDQIGAPTSAELLADVTAHCLQKAHHHPEHSGLYHLTADGKVSWYDYAYFVIEYARQAGLPITVNPEAIHAVQSTAFPSPAKRPHNSQLNTDHLKNTFGITVPDWKNGVIRMLAEMLERPF
jgi:dTDP-4-dehydrorhamnose reductase